MTCLTVCSHCSGVATNQCLIVCSHCSGVATNQCLIVCSHCSGVAMNQCLTVCSHCSGVATNQCLIVCSHCSGVATSQCREQHGCTLDISTLRRRKVASVTQGHTSKHNSNVNKSDMSILTTTTKRTTDHQAMVKSNMKILKRT